MEYGVCHLDFEKEDLKSDRPPFMIRHYVDYIESAKHEVVSQFDHDIELAEYYLDHFQYF